MLAAAACGGGGKGDPGDKRLHELAADGVFASLPAGATGVARVETKARYRKPGFSGGGWDGPSVVLSFRSDATPEQVYAFYGRSAAAAGWRETARGGLGLPDRWAKTYDDGAPATLILAQDGRGGYRLAGGVAPAT